MSYYLEIYGVPNSPQHVPLVDNSGVIGSAADSQIQIAHAEVSAQALMLDIRGNDFWVQNLNPYSIYVGMDEVAPNAWSPWDVGETIQLTKNVSLTVHKTAETARAKTGTAADGESGEVKSLDVSKIIQIIIIVLCFIGAPILLFTKNDEVTGVIDKEFNFNEIVENLQSKSKNIEYDTVRKYLQQAWMADRRWRKKNPNSVMKFYELLVNHRLVRENPDHDANLIAISDYAKRRLSDLRFDQSP